MIQKYAEKEDAIQELWNTFSNVASELRKRMASETLKTSLKPLEIKVMDIVASNEGISINQIAESMEVTGAWVTGLVNGLCENGYIVKQRNRTDQRTVRLSLTKHGQEKLKQARAVYRGALAEMMGKLSERDINELIRILKILQE